MKVEKKVIKTFHFSEEEQRALKGIMTGLRYFCDNRDCIDCPYVKRCDDNFDGRTPSAILSVIYEMGNK